MLTYPLGYGPNGPAASGLTIYDSNSGTWVPTYTPPPTSTLGNPPGSPSSTTTGIPGTGKPTSISGLPGSRPPGFTTTFTTALTTTNSLGSTTVIQTTETLTIPSSTMSLAPPSSSTRHPESNSSRNKHIIAIALGTVFGAIATVVVVAVAAYYCSKRRTNHRGWRKDEGDQTLIWRDDDDDDDDMLEGGGRREKGPTAVSGWSTAPERRTKKAAAWAVLSRGRSKPIPHRSQGQRFDMLADEDERQFADLDATHGPRRDGTTSSAGSYETGRPWYRRTASGKRSWAEVVNSSMTSVKSVGAAVTRQVSGGSNAAPDWWAKTEGIHPDEARLLGASDLAEGVAIGGIAARPRGGRQESSTQTYSSSNYHDPFTDSHEGQGSSGFASPTVEETEMGLMPTAGSSTGPGTAQYHNTQSSASTLEPTAAPVSTSVTSLSQAQNNRPTLHPLINVITATSDGSHSNSSNSRPSTSSGSSNTALPGSISNRSRSNTNLASPTGTVMSTAPSAPLKRSDSWWTRFSRTSLLGDHPGSPTSPRRLSFRLSGAGSTPEPPKFMDFRDPNPAPRLHAIEESGNTPDGSPDTPESRPPSAKRRSGIYGVHGRSSSSLQTANTADTDMLDRMGGRMDVVQRMRTASTHTASPSDASISSAIQGENMPSEHGEFVTSPLPLPTSPERHPALIGPRIPPPPPANSKVKRRPSEVAARVAAYERRASQDYGADRIPGGPRLPPTPTETAQERREKRKATASWGVVDKPELFVANPDARKGSGDTQSTIDQQPGKST